MRKNKSALGLTGNWLQLFSEPPAPPTPPVPPVPPVPPTPPAPPTPPTPPAPAETEQDRINKAAAAARRAAEQEGAQARDKAAQDLGYKDHGDMLTQVKAQRDAAKTQAEKDAEALKTANDRAAKGENALKLAEFKLKAAAKGVPADRVDAAAKLADLTKLTADLDAGTVAGADDAVTKLLADYPWLAGAAATPPPVPPKGGGGSNPPGGGTQKTLDEQLTDANTELLKATDPNRRRELAFAISHLETQRLRPKK